MHLSDLDLIDEIRGGSQAAFQRLMERHERLVYRIAWSHARQDEGALDICQNVFVKMHAGLASFDGRAAFSSWLARIACNESLNWLRGQRRHGACEELTPLNSPACEAPQEAAVLRDERRRRLLEHVGRLNDRQRQAVLLRYFERLPLRQVAEVMDCSEGTAKNVLFRSLEKLRRSLRQAGGRPELWIEETGS